MGDPRARLSSAPLRILSLSSVYPTPLEPGRGLFVKYRLERLGDSAAVKVVVPVWRWPLAGAGAIPRRRKDGAIEVLYPGWMYLPGTGALTALLLCLQLILPVRRLRKEFAFQVIDTHYGYPEAVAGAMLAALLNVPFTVTLRGSELLHSRYRLRRALVGWALRRASRVIAVSEELRRFAVGLGVDAANTRTIPNGVQASIFYPRDRAGLRAQLHIAPGSRVVLTAGHLIELKGHHYAIQAVKRLVDSGLPVRLLIAGGPPGRGVKSYEPELRRLIDELKAGDCVSLVGHVSVERLAELMSAADVFCLTSSREGWPNVVHEALACGTPVVANDIGAVPDLLANPEHGLIVPPNDVDSLAAALGRALAGSWNRSEISAAAHSRSWEQVADEVLNEMLAVVSQKQQYQAGVSPSCP